jgi:four helix bundle protein
MQDNSKSENQVNRLSGNQDTLKSNYSIKPVAGFEQLWVWQKSYKLMQEIHTFCRQLPREEKFRMRDQIERSSSSVCDNIAEGYTTYYYNDKIKGFNVARKEAGETQNHIRKISGKGYMEPVLAQKYVEDYEEVLRGINGYIRYIREKKGAEK